MRPKHPLRPVILVAVLLATGVGGWRYYEVFWKWRTLTPRVQQFLEAAQTRDTTLLHRLSVGSEPAARALALAGQHPGEFDTIISSLRFTSSAELKPDTISLTYETRATLCADAEPDVVQVRFVGEEANRRIDYVALSPC
jgi:hypothetical protein